MTVIYNLFQILGFQSLTKKENISIIEKEVIKKGSGINTMFFYDILEFLILIALFLIALIVII